MRVRRLSHGSADALLYIALAIAATWPLIINIATHATGAGLWNGREIYFETPTNIWNLWWFRFALVDLHQSPFNGTYIFHPVGADLWLHTLAPLPAAIGAVLQTFLSLVVTYNLLTLAAIVAAGVAAAALGRRLGLTAGSARLAGAIYAFAPALFARLYAGHFELLWIAWLPLTLLLFLRTIEDGDRGWRRAMWLGAAIAGAAYTSAYYAVYALEAMCVAAIVCRRQVFQRPAFIRLTVAFLVAFVCIAPMLAHVSGGEGAMGSDEERRSDFRALSLDALSFVVPSFMHPVLGDAVDGTNLRLSLPRVLPQESTAYLGLSVVALAVLGLWAATRPHDPTRSPPVFRRALPVALAAAFLVLSLGSELTIHGVATGIPMPAALLQHVPVLRMARAPGRHVYVAMLGVALLAGAGLARVPRHSWQVALLALVAFEYWPKVPLTDTSVPRVYHRLALAPSDIAVMDVPVGGRDGRRKVGQPSPLDLLGQVVHQKPIVGGMVSRLSDERWRAVRNAPLVGALMRVPPAGAVVPSEVLAYFQAHRISAIVVHPAASSGERELIQQMLPIAGREKYPDGTELWWVR